MSAKKTATTKKEALSELNIELSNANVILKKAEAKLKANVQAVGEIATKILNLQDLGLDTSALYASRKTKLELKPSLEADHAKKNKIFTDLSDQITNLSNEIFRDEVIAEVEAQKTSLKLSVPEVTKLVLHILKATHSENAQELIEKISRNSSLFQ
ncbi:hypothetical protein AO073_01550 [Pseudomonas syringae ICMP 11293]|uniref:hypothetical protein n=1 Tax=Pseudomonas syringae TaxID=317 RepID=UPI0007302339|nr:hypothetical protein [Pseudomonas syringae]KTB91586.1 hypothetical protein AO073_01550 [Pseudomonas syringae ICMP 11293]